MSSALIAKQLKVCFAAKYMSEILI